MLPQLPLLLLLAAFPSISANLRECLTGCGVSETLAKVSGTDNDEFVDPKVGGGLRRHAFEFLGSGPLKRNHFHIVSSESHPQALNVYVQNELIDVIQNPSHPALAHEERTGVDPFVKETQCIWKCLEAGSIDEFAPLDVGEKCEGTHANNRRFRVDDPDTIFYELGEYWRWAVPGPSCGYWTVSIRTNFEISLNVTRGASMLGTAEHPHGSKLELILDGKRAWSRELEARKEQKGY